MQLMGCRPNSLNSSAAMKGPRVRALCLIDLIIGETHSPFTSIENGAGDYV